jgi:hypothetical protein
MYAACPQSLAEALPVPAVVLVECNSQHRPLQLDLVGLYRASEYRRHGQLDGEAVGSEKSILKIGGGIGNAHLVEAEIGCRQQVQVDCAANPHLAPQETRGLLLDHAAIAVPVDEIGNRKQCSDDRDQKDCNGDKEIAHSPTPPVGSPVQLRSSPSLRRPPVLGGA